MRSLTPGKTIMVKEASRNRQENVKNQAKPITGNRQLTAIFFDILLRNRLE
jgi:hypothetical protein